MKDYKIRVRYSFEGTFSIEAENWPQAKAIAREHCGMVSGGIHTNNDRHVKDWNFPTHPDVKIIFIK